MDQIVEYNGVPVREYTLGGGKTNLISILLFIPIALINLGAFLIFWDYELFNSGKLQFFDYMLIILLLGIVVHELLHGLGWSIFAKKGFRSIKFGMNWNYFAPYCHCNEPLTVKQYRIGGALPLVVMGFIPSIIAIITGSGFLLSFGILFTAAAGGDMIVLYMLRNVESQTHVFDHPEKMGFYIEVNGPENTNL